MIKSILFIFGIIFSINTLQAQTSLNIDTKTYYQTSDGHVYDLDGIISNFKQYQLKSEIDSPKIKNCNFSKLPFEFNFNNDNFSNSYPNEEYDFEIKNESCKLAFIVKVSPN